MERSLAQELREGLNKGVVAFSYEKKNGEWREAHGTRNPQCLEYFEGTTPKGTGVEKEGTIAYWDLDVNGWRSCRESSIIDVRVTKTVEEYIKDEEDKAIQEGLEQL